MLQRNTIRRTFEYPAYQETQSLFERVRQTLEHTCTKAHGFILKVISIEHVHSRKISIYNGNIITDCTVTIEHLLPQVGQIMDGVVKQIFAQGCIVVVQECMKVFLPTVRAHILDVLRFRITQIRFQKGRYDCIAEIS